MKTNRRTSSILLTLICGIMLGLSGCMKDDMPHFVKPPDNTDQVNDDGRIANSYEVISIRHNGFSPADKSYAVSLWSDGRVIFEGQYNTLVLGQRMIRIDEATIQRVRSFFNDNRFFEFPEPVITNDIGTVSMSYRPMMTDKPFSVYSNDTPGNTLFTFAREVESILGVSIWVFGSDKREPMVDLKE